MIPLDGVQAETNARAARVEERCSYRVIGYVMEHVALPQRAVVADGAVRWFPNESDFTSMMGWRKHSAGPGVPAAGWPADEIPAPPPPAVQIMEVAKPSRPVLTAPPSAKLLESAEAALGELARSLGCVWNEDIPHNAGWFVGGKPTAYASAYDAIQALHAHLAGGGTVYRAPEPQKTVAEAITEPAPEPANVRTHTNGRAKPIDTRQEALF